MPVVLLKLKGHIERLKRTRQPKYFCSVRRHNAIIKTVPDGKMEGKKRKRMAAV